jgi:ferredoxin-thioredoxin reductase catalytic subunit
MMIKLENVNELYTHLSSEADAGGYYLNPDREFTLDLIEALLINIQRYGYQSCPCRLAAGVRDQDLDIICPCDYRDPDLAEFGSCYCALYVSGEIARGEREAEQIPERRKKPSVRKVSSEAELGSRGAWGKSPEGASGREGEGAKHPAEEHGSMGENPDGATGRLSDGTKELDYPVWRCPVCGYLCAREHPPEKCPICKADKDRFGRFL